MRRSVLVVGSGGLGSELITSLYTHLLSKAESTKENWIINIVDPDQLELCNYNRQYTQFFAHDQQRSTDALYKATCICEALCFQQKSFTTAEFLHSCFENNEWNFKQALRHIHQLLSSKRVIVVPHVTYVENLHPDELLDHELIISTLDNIESRRYINMMVVQCNKSKDNAELKKIKYIDVATTGMLGSIRYMSPPETSCYECSIGTMASEQNLMPLCSIYGRFTRARDFHQLIQHVLTFCADSDAFGFDSVQQHCTDIINNQLNRGIQTDTLLIESVKDIHMVQKAVTELKVIPSCIFINSILANLAMLWIAEVLDHREPSNDFLFYNGINGAYEYQFKYARVEDCMVCSATK